MNPVPFMLYREQLMKIVPEAPASSDALVVTDAVSRAATSQSFVSIAEVVVRIGPGADMALLTEVLRAARRSAHA
jgi:hypothetical protein